MFMPLLAALAIGATSAPQDEIVIIDDQPGIIIPLARFNLGRAEDLRRVRHRIAHAAISVCDRGYRGLSYFETAACVEGAIADADAQLGRIVAHNPVTTAATAAIAITAPAN